MRITRVSAREILDSRGNPTVEVDVTLEGGSRFVAHLPLGRYAVDADEELG